MTTETPSLHNKGSGSYSAPTTDDNIIRIKKKESPKLQTLHSCECDEKAPPTSSSVKRNNSKEVTEVAAVTKQEEEEEEVETFPPELIALILSYVDAITLARCSQVSSTLHFLSEKEDLWRRHYRSDFGSSFNYLINAGLGKDVTWREVYGSLFLLNKYGVYLPKSIVQFDHGLAYEIVGYHHDSNIMICRSEIFKNIHVYDISNSTSMQPEGGRTTTSLHMLGGGRKAPIFTATTNGCYLAGGSRRKIFVWIPETGIRMKVLRGHSNNVISLQYCDTKLASGSNDGTVKIWDTESWNCIYTIQEDHLYPIKLNSNASGNLLVCTSLDFTCRVWDLKRMKTIRVVDEEVWITQVEVSQAWVFILYSLDRRLVCWNSVTGETKVLMHPKNVRCFAVNHSASCIVTGTYDGYLRFWSLDMLCCRRSHKEAHGKRCIDFIKCDEFKAITAAPSSYSTDIKIWDVKSGNCIQVIKSKAPLELGLVTRNDIGVVSDLYFGSHSIVTISNTQALIRIYSLEIADKFYNKHKKQLAGCLGIDVDIDDDDDDEEEEEEEVIKKPNRAKRVVQAVSKRCIIM